MGSIHIQLKWQSELTILLPQTLYLLKKINDKLLVYWADIFLNMNKGSLSLGQYLLPITKAELSNYNQNFKNISI